MTHEQVTVDAPPESVMVLTRRVVPVGAWRARFANSEVGKYAERWGCDPLEARVAVRDDRTDDDPDQRIAATAQWADQYPADVERITFRDWCGREVRRLAKRGIRAWVEIVGDCCRVMREVDDE